jgi:hypothetical protein
MKLETVIKSLHIATATTAMVGAGHFLFLLSSFLGAEPLSKEDAVKEGLQPFSMMAAEPVEDIEASLEGDYGVSVRRGEHFPDRGEICVGIGFSAGYYHPVAEEVCYSSSGHGTAMDTLRQEAVHVVQKDVGVDKVSDFVHSNFHCEGDLSSSELEKIQKFYEEDEMSMEKQAWALMDEPKCVKALLGYFD